MKAIEEVYAELVTGDYFYGPSDYNPLLRSFGHEILLQVDDEDYQGDSRLVFKDGNRHGLLIFGWGSCSGCDALQACDSLKEVDELRSQLKSEIIWKDSKSELHQFIKDRDWETQYCWHSDETKQFVEKALALLGENHD